MHISDTVGYLHSIESFGAVDGPGIRYVVFLSGCPLNCLYCHNPDAHARGNNRITAGELFSEITQFIPYIKKGGVTVSGGEPLLQPDFVTALLGLCRGAGLHTAIDTSGGIELEKCKTAVDSADMLLLDMKAADEKMSTLLTGDDGKKAKKILEYCEKVGKPVWIRHVIVPSYTLDYSSLELLGRYLSLFNCVERIDLLPFHKLGEEKWKSLKGEYKLYDTKEPSYEEVKRAIETVRAASGKKVL